jgi:hypothetical protein
MPQMHDRARQERLSPLCFLNLIVASPADREDVCVLGQGSRAGLCALASALMGVIDVAGGSQTYSNNIK